MKEKERGAGVTLRTQSPHINIAFADDHTLVREGVGALLERERDMRVVASAGSARELLRALRRRRVDVVLMDVVMPRLNGIDAIPEVHRLCPDARVLMLSMRSDPECVYRAVRAGAAGYLLKSAAAVELVAAIRAVAAGQVYLCSKLAKTVSAHRLVASDALPTPLERLSRREREVLQLVAEGHTSREIAHLAGLSVRTVETYRTRLMRKLNVSNIASIVMFALRHSLVSLT